MSKLVNEFLNPADEFTPIPFWFWNDRLSHEEIKRQIYEFNDKGVNGFVLHPRIGIPKDIPYLSDPFMDYVLTAVKTAAALDMFVILYDEAMYPSGSANGRVVESNPEFASRGLRMMEMPLKNMDSPIEVDEGEQIVSIQAVEKLTKTKVNQQTIKVFKSEDEIASFTPENAEKWSVIYFIETFTKGTIRGIHEGEDDGEKNAPASVDLLNPQAVEAFINLTHERYYTVLEKYFGSVIIGFFTDEPDIVGRNVSKTIKPWTTNFLSDYLKASNKESNLIGLFFDIGENTEKIHKHYKKAINKRLSLTYYRALSKWCEEHHVALTGHPEQSDDIGLLEYFQIPGQDVVWRWVAPEDDKGITGEHSTAGKCSADAARHRARRRNLNEVLGVCGQTNGWDLTASDMKWYFDWLFVRGVNLISPHAFYYSIEGKIRSHERPPDVGPHNIWWPYYKQFSNYIKRLSWLMTDSVNQAKVAVLCQEDFLPWKITKPLYKNQIEFNYLEESLLSRCEIDSGSIMIEKQEYELLLVEDLSIIDESTRDFIKSFIKHGGKVLTTDTNSTPIDHEIVSTIDRLVETISDVIEIYPRLIPKQEDIRLSELKKNGETFYLLVNEGENHYRGTLQVNQAGAVEKWNPWQGTVEDNAVSRMDELTNIPFELNRRESIIFHLNQNKEPIVYVPKNPQSTEVIKLKNEWLINSRRQRKLSSWTKWEGMNHFSGSVEYEQEFILSAEQLSSAVLDLGEVHEIAEVWLNGYEVGVKMWAPYIFNLEKYLQAGPNQLRIKVTNSKANEMDRASLPSGMLGSVTINYSI